MGKYYWLKLPRDFFKRHDMIILESMDNGWTYEMIFVKLLAESIDHDGELRFSDSIPYNSKMLSSICRTDEKTMEEALNAFQSLGLVKIDKKKTLSVPIATKMIGSAEDNDAANRQRRCRERKREESASCDKDVTKCHTEVTEKRDKDVTKDNESKRKRKSKSKSIEIEKEEENNELFSSLSGERPTENQVMKFASDHKINRIIDPKQFFEFYQELDWKIDGQPIRDWRSLLMKWASNVKDKKNVEVQFMQNEYSEEHLRQREQESMAMLDSLLEE